MKGERNILITSLSAAGNRWRHSYYWFEEDGQIRYCDGLSVAEAGTKYLLSSVPIDAVIVVGEQGTYYPNEGMEWSVLRDWSEFSQKDTGMLSEYGFFQYRITQYLNSIDLEAIDVLEDITQERKEELLEGYQNLYRILSESYPGLRRDRVFHTVAQDENQEKLLNEAFGPLEEHDLLWLKRFMYSQLADNMKLFPRQDSEDMKICFVPLRKAGEEGYVPAQNVYGLIEKLKEDSAETVNIYMDMQGLESAEGYMILGVLSMLGEDHHSHLRFREIITTHNTPDLFVNLIDNSEMKRYDINRLVSGMHSFIRYGKVDEILRYWQSRGIANRHIDVLLYAMKQIDESISLCSIGDLEAGIRLLKYTLDNTPGEELAEVETNVFRILESTIRADYGSLLESEELDEFELVRWAIRKKFYQQAVTIIESRMPDVIFRSRMFYYADDEESLSAFRKELNNLYWAELPKDRWCYKELEHYFIKIYGRSSCLPEDPKADRLRLYAQLRVKSLHDQDENFPLKKSYSILKDREDLLEEVLYTYYKASDVRNKINHAADNNPAGELDLHQKNEHLVMLEETLNAFLNAYEAARTYMKEQGLDPEPPLKIDQEKFRSYTYFHRPKGGKNRDKKKDMKPADQNRAAAQNNAPAPSGGPKNVPAQGSGTHLLTVTLTIEK